MLSMVAVDIIILLAVGVPIAVLHRKWRAWVDRQSANLRPFREKRRFGLRSWAARSFVLEKPVEHVREMIDDLSEMSYAEAAAMVQVRGRPSNFMALAPLTGKQVFETGIETEWLSHDTAEIGSHSYADWPLNATDEGTLPAKQHQMVFEHAFLRVEPHDEGQTQVSYELETPAWVYLLYVAIVLLVAWVTWLVGRALDPVEQLQRTNLALMALLTTCGLARMASVLRLQSIALMDSVIRTFGSPVPTDESES